MTARAFLNGWPTKRGIALVSPATVRKIHRAIWTSLDGCDCDPRVPKRAGQRCTASAVRCNGRLAVINARMKRAGLTFGGAS